MKWLRLRLDVDRHHVQFRNSWASGVLPTDKIGVFNGDGRDDIIQLYASGTAFVWLSNGTRFQHLARLGHRRSPASEVVPVVCTDFRFDKWNLCRG
jgi:hypothetical protein